MLIARIVAAMFSGGLMFLGTGVVCGQNYPNKPLRMVTAEPGGGADFVARLIAQGLSGNLGQPVIVDNRGTGPDAELVAKAPPDGYTLLLQGTTFWIGPLLQKTSYDAVKDFSSISMLTRSPTVLVVHPSVAVNSVKELIALAKAKPGVLNYSSSGIGAITHLSAELFKAMAGVNIVRIPYKGTGPAFNALLGGEVQLAFPTAGAVAPHLTSSKLRALAVTSSEPSVLAPGLPTVAASGLPGYEAVSILAMFVPLKTPPTIINRLNLEIVQFLNRPDVKVRFLNSGVETAGGSPEELAAKIKSEIARYGKVIKDAGIKAD